MLEGALRGSSWGETAYEIVVGVDGSPQYALSSWLFHGRVLSLTAGSEKSHVELGSSLHCKSNVLDLARSCNNRITVVHFGISGMVACSTSC